MEKFHEREVMKRAKISKGSADKILRKLAKLDLLMREEKGRMVFYKLNMENPVARQFKILYNVWNLRKVVEKVGNYSRKIILFGSCAEGTDTKESDIDLLIIAEEKRPVEEAISEFNKKSERKISPIIVNANELVKLKEDKPFFERIEKGIVLWEKD